MRVVSVWSAALLLTVMTLVASAATGGGPVAQQEPVDQQAPGPWVHVEISGDSRQNMNLNLPLAAIEAMIALAPDTIVQDGQLRLGSESEVPVAAIRAMWQELREVGETEFVTMEYERQDVRIAREGDSILVDVSDRDGDGSEAVRVEVPVPVVDALLSADGDTLDVRAALEELSALSGELVRVIEADSHIRIWIDESPTQ